MVIPKAGLDHLYKDFEDLTALGGSEWIATLDNIDIGLYTNPPGYILILSSRRPTYNDIWLFDLAEAAHALIFMDTLEQVSLESGSALLTVIGSLLCDQD